MEDDLLSVAQAAHEVGCHRSTITRRVQLGRLEAAWRHPGTGAIMLRRSDVERLATDFTHPPTGRERP